MRRLSILFLFTFSLLNGFAQNSPRGMKYQAVARDLKGEVLANSKIELRINLLSKTDGIPASHYREVHSVVTNQLGLFTLVVGEGKMESGEFDTVPWSTADIWMEIQIKANGQTDFTSISNSQLLAVPYAYYALKAGELANDVQQPNSAAKGHPNPNCPCEGGLSQIKVLFQGGPVTPVTVKVYRNKNLTELITTITPVTNGDILTINAINFPDGKLKNETYFQVLSSPTGPALSVVEIPTECEEFKEPWEFSLGETFGNFSVLSHRDRKNGAECTVCDIRKEWQVGGNGLMDLCNKLGTRSYTDLVFITNNIERLRITKDGAVNLKGNLEIGDDLTVKRDAFLNTNQLSGGVGSTINYGPLTVEKNTDLKGKLDVTGFTLLKNSLTVNGATDLKSALDVTGATLLKNSLTTNGATDLKSTLDVMGATHLKNTLLTDGATTINNSLTVNKSDPNFVATFINRDANTGDGIQIKLGKTHPAWNGSYLNVPGPADAFSGATTTIKSWVIDHTPATPAQLLTLIPATYHAALACNVVNMITARLNTVLHLPAGVPSVILPALNVTISGATIPIIGQTTLLSGFTLIPPIPTIDCSALGLPSFSVPNISFVDVNNSLSNANQFISFVDNENRSLGSIRAQSVVDWRVNYLDAAYFASLVAGMVGIDVVNGVANAIAGFTTMAKSFNQLGVEYSSGHADYAEWLERINPAEIINAGDIVGVKGGRVSKNLEGAEQILAVSHNPIVLGNAQSKEREPYGNKIAFTGQVPVKVVGPVNMGDYIIAKGNIQGYGIAVSPANLTTDDLRLAVGRSWETNLNDGPKMVNTLIGIDNGDYIKIMKESQDKIITLETRMKEMEEKMDKIISGGKKDKTTNKRY